MEEMVALVTADGRPAITTVAGRNRDLGRAKWRCRQITLPPGSPVSS